MLQALILSTVVSAAPLKLALDPKLLNPIAVLGAPADVTGTAERLGGCTKGKGASIADEPFIELTLVQPVKQLQVTSSVPWAMVFPDGTIECSLDVDRPSTVRGAVPAGVAKFYPLGQSLSGAGLSIGYQRGERATVQFEAADWPLKFDTSGVAEVKVPAEPAEPLLITLDAPAKVDLRTGLTRCGFWNPRPSAILDVASLRAATLTPGFSRETAHFAVVGPLDAARDAQRVWCQQRLALAKDEFLEGRYAVFASPNNKSRATLLLSGPKTSQPVVFRVSPNDDLDGLSLEQRVLRRHYPGFPTDAFALRSPQDFEKVVALWKAVPAALLVTPKTELAKDLLARGETVLAAGEPLLLLGLSGDGATVLTVDGEQDVVSPKFLVAKAPASPVLPATRRGPNRVRPDDDLNFEFVTEALKPEHDRFKKLDEKGAACWDKHYNSQGRGLDVVTYVNGRITNVESLDARFRKVAEKACKRDFDAAEKAGKALREKLAKERRSRYEQAFADAKAAVLATCGAP
jgi:hypothetical protein